MLDYRGLYAQLCDVGTALNDGGVGQGDRVALLISNGPEAAAAFLSVSCFATAVPVKIPSSASTNCGGYCVRCISALLWPIFRTILWRVPWQMSSTRRCSR